MTNFIRIFISRLSDDEIQKEVNEYRQELLRKMQKALENREDFLMEIEISSANKR